MNVCKYIIASWSNNFIDRLMTQCQLANRLISVAVSCGQFDDTLTAFAGLPTQEYIERYNNLNRFLSILFVQLSISFTFVFLYCWKLWCWKMMSCACLPNEVKERNEPMNYQYINSQLNQGTSNGRALDQRSGGQRFDSRFRFKFLRAEIWKGFVSRNLQKL